MRFDMHKKVTKLNVTIEMGRCANCARGSVTPVMLESKTLLCVPYCLELFLNVNRMLEADILKAWRAYFSRQSAVPGFAWTRFSLKRTVRKRA